MSLVLFTRSLKSGLVVLFSILFVAGLFSIEPPKEPIPPQIDQVEKKDNGKKDSKKEKNLKKVEISAKLCDGRQIQGEIEYEKEEISFHHIKEGIKYDKKLKVSEMKQMKILSWELKKGKKVKDGVSYQAFPSKIQITVLNGENYILKGIPDAEYLNLNVSNQNGVAKLYTYWLDLLYDTGGWYSKLGTVSGSEREDCHPDVIRTIQFN